MLDDELQGEYGLDMASAEKSGNYWREHHGLSSDYKLDAAIFYGTWPHKNKVEPNHIVPLCEELDKMARPDGSSGQAYGLHELGDMSEYLDHGYELRLPDVSSRELTTWIVPVEGTRLASEYVEMTRHLRAKKMVILGMCAGLLEGMRPGQFVMPTGVLPNDTGQNYNAAYPHDMFTRPESTLFDSLRRRVLYHDPQAEIWQTRGYTHEALRRQTRSMAEAWAADGFGTIDMETGLLFGAGANPELAGPPIPAAALLYITDNPRQGTTPSEAGHLLSVNDARTLQYRVAIEEIRNMPTI